MTMEVLSHRPRSGSRLGISGSGELGGRPDCGGVGGVLALAEAALAMGGLDSQSHASQLLHPPVNINDKARGEWIVHPTRWEL